MSLRKAAVICSENYWQAEISSKRSDGPWNGVVWYADEQGAKKRKSFCGTTKQEVKEKITAYLADFDRQLTASDESKAELEESMADGSGYSNFHLWNEAPTTGWSALPSIRSTRSSAARWLVTSPRQISKPY